jgi:hypothetical protein
MSYLKEQNCYGIEGVIASAPDEFGYLLSVVSTIAKGNLIGLGSLQIKVGVMLPCHAYGTQNLDAI